MSVDLREAISTLPAVLITRENYQSTSLSSPAREKKRFINQIPCFLPKN